MAVSVLKARFFILRQYVADHRGSHEVVLRTLLGMLFVGAASVATAQNESTFRSCRIIRSSRRRFRLFRRGHRLFHPGQPERRHQWRKIVWEECETNTTRFAVECYERLKMPGAAPSSRCRLARLWSVRAGRQRQDPDDDQWLRPVISAGRPRLPVVFPLARPMGPGRGDDRLPDPEGRRPGQLKATKILLPRPAYGKEHPGVRCAPARDGLS